MHTTHYIASRLPSLMAGNNTQDMMSTNTDVGIIILCIVCNEVIHPRPVNLCPDCGKPCHTRCAARKTKYSCDFCRNENNKIHHQLSTKTSPAVLTTTGKTRAKTSAHLRRRASRTTAAHLSAHLRRSPSQVQSLHQRCTTAL